MLTLTQRLTHSFMLNQHQPRPIPLLCDPLQSNVRQTHQVLLMFKSFCLLQASSCTAKIGKDKKKNRDADWLQMYLSNQQHKLFSHFCQEENNSLIIITVPNTTKPLHFSCLYLDIGSHAEELLTLELSIIHQSAN